MKDSTLNYLNADQPNRIENRLVTPEQLSMSYHHDIDGFFSTSAELKTRPYAAGKEFYMVPPGATPFRQSSMRW